MAVHVNADLIKKVAELSRLELKDAEIAEYAKSIGEILNYVEQLNSVNVMGIDGKEVEPMYYGIDGSIKLREDRVVEFAKDENGKPKILMSAPEVEDDGFKVPPIL